MTVAVRGSFQRARGRDRLVCLECGTRGEYNTAPLPAQPLKTALPGSILRLIYWANGRSRSAGTPCRLVAARTAFAMARATS
jgi:hypothetical protein